MIPERVKIGFETGYPSFFSGEKSIIKGGEEEKEKKKGECLFKKDANAQISFYQGNVAAIETVMTDKTGETEGNV